MSMVFAVLLCLPGNVYQDFFEQGNTAYTENRLDDAVQAYERLVSSGVKNAPVFYNLANAYYHAGDVGHAVLNYERALAVDPNFDPAERGLEALLPSSSGKHVLPTGFRSPMGRYSKWLRVLLWTTLLTFWWLFWGILLLSQWRTVPYVRALALVALGCVVLLTCIVYALATGPQPGVVLTKDSSLRYGPDVRDGLRTLLRAGERVSVEHIEDAWARIETSTGLRGWVKREQLGAVNPPFN
jgi:tetratricopeptide (TPR) repeat protein